MKKIFIDPGHGGSDPGATVNGLMEKDFCLTIALKLRNILNQEYKGHAVKLSRTIDTTLTLKQRTDMANHWGADYLVSVHINAGGGTGFESYTFNGSYVGKDETNRLRNLIHDEIIKGTGFKDRGRREANFHMLRESSMHGMLTENGFIDSRSDASNLNRDAFLRRVADGHARGLVKALGLKKNSGVETDALIHLVQKGDTLWSIAKKYNVTVYNLLRWNPGIDPECLPIDYALIVGKTPATYHTIQKGNTLWGIAIQYDASVAELLELNPGLEPEYLQIGEKIRIR